MGTPQRRPVVDGGVWLSPPFVFVRRFNFTKVCRFDYFGRGLEGKLIFGVVGVPVSHALGASELRAGLDRLIGGGEGMALRGRITEVNFALS